MSQLSKQPSCVRPHLPYQPTPPAWESFAQKLQEQHSNPKIVFPDPTLAHPPLLIYTFFLWLQYTFNYITVYSSLSFRELKTFIGLVHYFVLFLFLAIHRNGAVFPILSLSVFLNGYLSLNGPTWAHLEARV